MASNQTEQYGLSLWEPTDDFLREEFNANNRILEAGLTQKCEMATGVYTGDGTSSRFISLPFTPSAVLVTSSTAEFRISNAYYGGLALLDYPSGPSSSANIAVEEGGFTISYRVAGSTTIASNMKNSVYYYVAWR